MLMAMIDFWCCFLGIEQSPYWKQGSKKWRFVKSVERTEALWKLSILYQSERTTPETEVIEWFVK